MSEIFTLTHFRSKVNRKGGDLEEQINGLWDAVESIKDCGKKYDDRISKLEASVVSIQSSLKEFNERFKLLETKFRVKELREERMEVLSVALERLLDKVDNNNHNYSRESPQGSVGVTNALTRSERKRNLDKLLAIEKCQPVLDYPERVIKTPVRPEVVSPVLIPGDCRNVSRRLYQEHPGQQMDNAAVERRHEIGAENERSTLIVEENQGGVLEEDSEPRLSEETEILGDKEERSGKVDQDGNGSDGPSTSKASLKKRKSSGENLAVEVSGERNKSVKDHPECKNGSQGEVVDSEGKSKEKRGGKKQFPCSVCGKVYKCRKNLGQHESAHLNGKLQCEACEYETEYRKELKKHVQVVHNPESPLPEKTFRCLECKNRYTSERTLREHEKVHIRGKLHCSLCDHKCIHDSVMLLHFKANHPKYVQKWRSKCFPEIKPSGKSTVTNTNEGSPQLTSSLDRTPAKSRKKKSKKILKIKLPLTPSRSSHNPENSITPETSPESSRYTEAGLNSTPNSGTSTATPTQQNGVSAATPFNKQDSKQNSTSDSSPNPEPPSKKKKRSKNPNPPTSPPTSPVEVLPEPESPKNLSPTDSKRKKNKKNKTNNNNSSKNNTSPELNNPNEATPPQLSPGSSPEAVQVHFCPVCSKVCRSVRKLDRHLRKKH